MLGAIIGDVVGSLYEWRPIKTKDFPLFSRGCRPTDDSVMTIAVGVTCAEASLTDETAFLSLLTENMRMLGRLYPRAGYGGSFAKWLASDTMGAYNSFGNGSAMRVSPVGWACDTLEDTLRVAKWSAEVTHDHPAGIAGAQAVAGAIYLARTGSSKDEIRSFLTENFYDMDFTLDEIQPDYSFDVTCAGSVPEALACFLEGEDFEDTVRNAVSLGGDSDTQAAIAGSVAEAFFGIPADIEEEVFEYLDETLSDYYWEYASLKD